LAGIFHAGFAEIFHTEFAGIFHRGLAGIFLTGLARIFQTYFHSKFNISASKDSLVNAVKLNPKGRFSILAMLAHVLQKIKNCCTFCKSLLRNHFRILLKKR
jgi:hypothetical protein